MLTGPLFMLQVYDRVLTSRSEATLVALITLVAFLFLMMGILDYARGRVLARAGARLQARLDPRVLRAILVRSISPDERARPATGLRDLEAIHRFSSGSGPFAFFDAPWTPIFLFLLFTFHWLLGLLAVAAGCLLLLLALFNQMGTARLQREVGEATARSGFFVDQMRAGSETVQGLGMHDAVVERSGALRDQLLDSSVEMSDRIGFFSVTTRTLRLFLQSMMLALGAWLAIHGQITPGVMIAASILLGRALAPIDQAVGQWPVLQRALTAWRSLSLLLEETPPATIRTELPAPRAMLEVQDLIVVAPGARIPAVRRASLRLEPGQAAGIAGPSASGKSTLARALAGVWKPLAGSVRLDGAELEQYGSSLGQYVGYLPQDVILFDGTVAENIARFSPTASDAAIVEAAKRTGGHEMILGLQGGYDFPVSSGGAALSGGQRQRIALARAFYGRPVVVVMDEPDSNLDAEGTMALARAVENQKKKGGAIVVVAHRHGAFAQCDTVYVMENGQPVPVNSGRRSAPLRKLQAGGNKVGNAPSRQPARANVSPAKGKIETLPRPRPAPEVARIHPQPGERGEEVAAPLPRIAESSGAADSLPAQRHQAGSSGAGDPAAPARHAGGRRQSAPSREEQVAQAITRVTGARETADTVAGPRQPISAARRSHAFAAPDIARFREPEAPAQGRPVTGSAPRIASPGREIAVRSPASPAATRAGSGEAPIAGRQAGVGDAPAQDREKRITAAIARITGTRAGIESRIAGSNPDAADHTTEAGAPRDRRAGPP